MRHYQNNNLLARVSTDVPGSPRAGFCSSTYIFRPPDRLASPSPERRVRFVSPTSWSLLVVGEVDKALVSCQQTTCRERQFPPVCPPLPCPAALRLTKLSSFSSRPLIYRNKLASRWASQTIILLFTQAVSPTPALTPTLSPDRTVALIGLVGPRLGGSSGIHRKGTRCVWWIACTSSKACV